jgi:hypothetical protein
MKQEQGTEGHPIIENFNSVSNNTSVVFTQNCEVELAITAVAEPEGSSDKIHLT